MKTASTEYFGISRKIVSNMTSESWETIPHTCVTYEPKASDFLIELKKINSLFPEDKKITVNTAVLKVITEGIKACPKINSHIQFNRKLVRGRVDIMKNIDVSMPVILKTGEMMTLNIHGMENKSITEIRDAVKDSVSRADNSDMNEAMFEVSMDNTIQGLKKGRIMQTVFRLIGSKTGKHKVKTLSGKAKAEYYSKPADTWLTKQDIEQGTITISNLGSIYRGWRGECTLLEIIPPQVAAIGIGAVQSKPVCTYDDEIKAGKILPVTVAFDHRALDMGDIIPFFKKLDEIFANPQIINLWI